MQAADKSTELSARRTGMSFQRTRMSADRTLMSVIRTSLSLISFGFTIHQLFRRLADQHVLPASDSTRTYGEALIWLGIGLIAAGIVYHALFMLGLRRERASMVKDGLIHAESGFPPSATLIVAVLLLLLGIAAVAAVGYHWGPLA